MGCMEILIADDHELFRRGLRMFLESRPEWHVCGEAADGKEAVAKAKELKPDVVLLDVSMPKMNGLEAARAIRLETPGSEILIVSQNDAALMEKAALQAGATRYIQKTRISPDLTEALEALSNDRQAANETDPKKSVIAEPGKSTGEQQDVVEQSREQQFRAMIDALPVAIYTTDAEGWLTHFNPAAVKFSGRVPELGTDRWCISWKILQADGTPLPHEKCPMAVALQEGRIIEGAECIAERPDGTRIWFTPHPRPLRDACGKIVGGINMLVDITQKKRAEQANSLLAAIVGSSDDAIISKNFDGIITSWNKSAERIFGYTADEAIGKSIMLLVPADCREEEEEIIARLRRGERVDHFETTRMRKDGSTLDVSLTISPVRDSTGRVVGASKVARDITDRKLAERALRESEEKFRKLSESLDVEVRLRMGEIESRNNGMLKQSDQLRDLSQRLLQAQDEERRHIARELHDSAGQTLTVLEMNLARFLREAQQNAPHLAEDAKETQQLVRQLTREIRTTSYLLHPPLLDESGLASALGWYIEGVRERSGLDIMLAIPEEFGRIPREIELVVFRLVQECLTNIHRHSGSKRASIQIARENESVSIKVEDQGKGMSREKLAEIQSHGSGVGIRGMHERVRHFHGNMQIESSCSGTKISVSIPLSVDGQSQDRTAIEPIPTAHWT